MYRSQVGWPSPFYLYLNGTPAPGIPTLNNDFWAATTGKWYNTRIEVANGKVLINLGTIAQQVLNLNDTSANWRHPKTFRIITQPPYYNLDLRTDNLMFGTFAPKP